MLGAGLRLSRQTLPRARPENQPGTPPLGLKHPSLGPFELSLGASYCARHVGSSGCHLKRKDNRILPTLQMGKPSPEEGSHASWEVAGSGFTPGSSAGKDSTLNCCLYDQVPGLPLTEPPGLRPEAPGTSGHDPDSITARLVQALAECPVLASSGLRRQRQLLPLFSVQKQDPGGVRPLQSPPRPSPSQPAPVASLLPRGGKRVPCTAWEASQGRGWGSEVVQATARG